MQNRAESHCFLVMQGGLRLYGHVITNMGGCTDLMSEFVWPH